MDIDKFIDISFLIQTVFGIIIVTIISISFTTILIIEIYRKYFKKEQK